MHPDDRNKYLDILELSPDATFSEIRNAYLHLKSLYSRDSIVTLTVKDEIPQERKEEILREIEEAYQSLLTLFEKKGPGLEREKTVRIDDRDFREEVTSEVTAFSGQTLKEIRERLNIDLQDIALSTKIQSQYLENIETETFDGLPPEAYARGFVVSYAEYLGLDAKKVADDYMKRYRIWKDVSGRKR
jgi:curved DNA-binding protein CbpA